MGSHFLHKTVLITILFNCSFIMSMSFEEIQNAITLWASKKLQIQEIPFDRALLDGKEIVTEDFLKSKKIEHAQIRVFSKLLFDSTNNYLQQKFSKIIEHTEIDDLASHMNWNQNYFSVIYDVKTLKKIDTTLLKFEQPIQYVHLCDHTPLKEISPFLKCCNSIIVNELIVSYIAAFKDEKTGKNMLGFSINNKIFHDELSISNDIKHIVINNDITMMAVALIDGRIFLVSPIKIDTFSDFNSNYDINFVFLNQNK